MKRLIIPFILSVMGLTVLLSLGTWQMQRHVWKQNLLENIKAGKNAEPVSLTNVKQLENSGDVHFQKVTLTGRLHLGVNQFVYALREGNPGYLVFTPLEMSEGAFLYINRGFLSERERKSFKNDIKTSIEDVKIKGYVRPREKGNWFTPPPSVKNSTWYVADIMDMARTAKLNMATESYYIDAAVGSTNSSQLQGRELDALVKSIPNNHFAYALTWYGLACALLGVFIAFAWAGRKEMD